MKMVRSALLIRGSASSRFLNRSLASFGRGRALVLPLLLLLGLAVLPCRATWVERYPDITSYWSGVAFGNNTFVAVGSSGKITRSTDFGESWNGHEYYGDDLNAVAYGNGTFVAVGNNGRVFRSVDDGENWIDETPVDENLNGIAFGNGWFVAVGDGGNTYRSGNGASWTLVAINANNLNGIAFGNGWFVAVGDRGWIHRSNDNGSSWERIEYSGADLHAVAFGNSTFVTAGSRAYCSTDNGESWDWIALGYIKNGMAFGDGQFVVCCRYGHIYESDINSSSDWNSTATGASSFYAAAFGNHVFVVVGLRNLYIQGTAAWELSPTFSSVVSSGGSESFSVSAPGGFNWTATTSESWVHITSGASGTGNGMVSYSVTDPNPASIHRTATIQVGNLMHTITQFGDRTATEVSPSQASFEYAGGSRTFSVSAPAGREWTANCYDSWISIDSGSPGSGDGTVGYTVGANNSGEERIGYIYAKEAGTAIYPRKITIIQQPVYYEIDPPTSASFGYHTASGNFSVSASYGAAWVPTSSDSWIHIGSYTGTGRGTVQYTIDENVTPSSRTGKITVHGLDYTIQQGRQILSAVEVTPSSLDHGSNLSSGRFTVIAGESTTWIASESLSWVTLVGDAGFGVAGTGTETVSYVVDSNTGPLSRDGVVNVSGGAGDTHGIQQAGSGYSIAPVSGTYAAWDSVAMSGNFSVSPIDTGWSASSAQSWITDTGYGKGKVYFEVANNTSWNSRKGTVDATLGGVTMQYQVYQNAGTLVLEQSSFSFGYNGGSDDISITSETTPSLQWTATSDRSWLTITSGGIGTGEGTVSFQAASNPTYSSRSGTITIADKTIAISQSGRPLVFSIDPYEKNFSKSGGSTSVQVYGPPDQGWTAQESLSWVTITSSSSGTGDGTVIYSVSSNPDMGSRSGTITIASETHSINQEGNLAFYSAPTASGFNAAGGNKRVTVSSNPSGVAWTATSEVPWVSITGTGSGYFDVHVEANGNVSNRTGRVKFGSDSFSSYAYYQVDQSGATAAYSISPASTSIPGGGGQGSVTVTATDGAGWTATSPVGWVTVSTGSGIGNGVVSYTVDPNSTTNARSAVLTIAGKSHTVSQASGDTPSYCWVDPSSIRENLPDGTTVGTLQIESYLPVTSPVFTLPAGYADGSAFSISNDLLLSTAPFDAETKDCYFPGIHAENGHGGSWEGQIAVSVDDDTMEDADADGLPEEDEIFQGSDDTVLDADGDGVSDGDEVRIAGTDPLDPASCLRIAQIAPGCADWIDLEWVGVTGKTYKVLASDNLPDGFPFVIGETTNGFFSVHSDTYPHRFFRLAATAPVVQQDTKLLASDGVTDDRFGNAEGISGNTLVVGSKFDDDLGSSSGSAYLYERSSASNDWNFVAKLTASDGAASDEFGYAVAIDGDTVAVGAKKDNSARGAVYLFERNAGGAGAWGQVKKITASDSATSDYFGYRVVLDGDRLAVGSGHGSSRQGVAYIFERNSGGTENWGEVEKLTTPDGQIDDQFGWSIALSGDTVAVGAYADDDLGSDAGAVYLFERDAGGAGAWGQTHKLFGAGAVAGDLFGVVLDLDGDTLAVGAPQDNERARRAGAAYVFERDRNGVGAWGQTRKVRFAEGGSWNLFGNALDLDGDNLAIGAWNAYNGVGVKSGTAFLFQRDLNGSDRWGLLQRFVPTGATEGQSFGGSISISGDTILAGATGDDTTAENSGAAYVFRFELP